jgi:hypothetical protein
LTRTFCYRKSKPLTLPHNIAHSQINSSQPSFLLFPSFFMSPSTMLITLPFEIQTLIISFLDYHSLIDLLKTGRHFRKLVTKKIIKAALWALEEEFSGGYFGPGLTPKTRFLRDMSCVASYLPCYECLRGLPNPKYFLPYQIADNYAFGAKHAFKRRCAGCTHKRATWIESSELFCAGGAVFIDCARCRKTTRHESRESSKIAWTSGKCCFDCYKMLVFESLAALDPEIFKNPMAEEADWNLLDISIILFGGPGVQVFLHDFCLWV